MLLSTAQGLTWAVLVSSVSAAFNPQAKTNVAVYWGQGPNQKPLLETCKSSAVDIINIGFVNAFPDNSPGAYPGSNFGNACGDETYTVNGVKTLLKSNCPRIGSDIIECQKTYGKKIFLSFGGASPLNYYIANDASANNFADFVWGAFGPSTSAWKTAGKPRPFGDAVVDGFDFDIESYMSTPPKDASGNTISDYQSRGYAAMINRLKNTQFPKDTSKSYFISGAPQCPLPDVHLSGPIANAWFDMLFVQFYNNPSCSGRAAVNYAAGDSFLKWTKATSKNPNVKIYFGLPASTKAVPASSAGDYLSPAEAKDLVQRFSTNAKWGGIMLWESTYSQNNLVCNKEYATWMKDIVTAITSGKTIDTDISKCSTVPSPIQSGIISTCNQYLKTNSGGAKCSVFAERAQITLAQLYAWNSILGPNGENCASKFVGDTYYCVGVTPPPGSVQSGITPYCTKYKMAPAGGSCPTFAKDAGISTSNFYAWNPVLGNSGQNCASQFWGNTYYCVGVSPNYPTSTAKPTTTGASPAPGPTQSGIISTCSKYLMANPGGSCPVFAQRAGISTSQLYAWNSVLGNNGQNCASQFWANTYYCVGVRSSKAKRNAAAEITGYVSPPAYGNEYPEEPTTTLQTESTSWTTVTITVSRSTITSAYPVLTDKPQSEVAPAEYTSKASQDVPYSESAISKTVATTYEVSEAAQETTAASTTSSTAPSDYTLAAPSNGSTQVISSSLHHTTAITHEAVLPSNSTLATVSTGFVIPSPHSPSASTGYISANTTAVATGTGVPRAGYTTATFHPYTGAGSVAKLNIGLIAILAGAGFLLL